MESTWRTRLSAPVVRFLDQRPWIADLGLAVLLAILGTFSRPTISFETASQTAYSLIVIGCCLAVAVRRRWPRASLTVIALLLICHLAVVPEPGLFALSMCLLAAYTAQTQTSPPWRWLLTILTVAGATCGLLLPPTLLGTDWRARIIAAAAVSALLAAAALVGMLRRQRRTRYEVAIDRAAMLEAQQDVERRLAASEERAMIAREMHDILGHSLNAIAAQAEGTRYVLRADPERADTALADIGRLSRAAVDEVRDLIDVLRTEDEPALRRPAPALADVPELIGSFDTTNEHIRLHVEGDLAAVSGQVSLTAYRIVQEALTNAVKHAPDSPVTVRIAVTERTVRVIVANSATPHALRSSTSHGHGLVGMRERAQSLGGSIEAGPDSATGGWKVTATLPRSRA